MAEAKQEGDRARARPVEFVPHAGALGLVLIVLAFVCALASLTPPPTVPADAPTEQFSGERALQVLERLLVDDMPHPTGSAASARTRARLRAELTALGLTPEEQATISCDPTRGRCAPVTNVFARIPGERPGPALMLTAHYDSVGAASGAGDDGQGVAVVLETARALLGAKRPPTHSIVLLFTDAEELGLLGARAFVKHPLADEVAVAINAEARGTCGRSMMFETSDNNAWLIDAYARASARPSATSLSYEVYRRMPNDTDLTVFRERGMAGLNFAFVGNLGHYHTRHDDLAHLCRRSVQHQGEQFLASARALSRAPSRLDAPPSGDAVYTDLLGRVMVRWPVAWALPLNAALLVGALALLLLGARRRLATRAALAWAALCFVLALLGPILIGLLINALIGAISPSARPWYATPGPTRGALVLACLLGLVPALQLARARAGAWSLAAITWTLWSALALALAVLIPGASVVLTLPVAAGLVGLALVGRPGFDGHLGARAAIGLAAGPCLAVVLLIPLLQTLELAFGLGAAPLLLPAYALSLTALAAPLAAVWPRRARALTLALAAVTLALAVYASRQPEFNSSLRQPLNIVLYEDYDSGRTRWLATAWGAGDSLPRELTALTRFERARVDEAPFLGRAVYQAAAAPPSTHAATPIVRRGESRRGDARVIQLQLRATHGVGAHWIELPPERIERLTLQGLAGEVVAVPTVTRGGRALASFYGVSAEGLALELTVRGDAPVDITVTDAAYGLPPEGDAYARARDVQAMPRQHGDMHLIRQTTRF